jgi:RNA polymerase sigma-70 factor (ECF subfamily)
LGVLTFRFADVYLPVNGGESTSKRMRQTPVPVTDSGVATRFTTTHWSVVVAAGAAPSAASERALEVLCRAYWYPLYAYLRRGGRSPHDAQDLVQEFFKRLLSSDWISRADPNKGRFRTFLLCGLQNFLGNEWQKANRLKRGGGHAVISLDAATAEQRYALEPAELASPDKLFDRRWAMTILESVLDRLQHEEAEANAGERFEVLRSTLLGEPSEERYRELATRFGVAESTVKSWVHRLRLRYRELLREEISRTVAAPGEVQEELRHVLRALIS